MSKKRTKKPIKRTALFLVFVVAEIILVLIYLQNRDFINHLTPSVVSQAYWPSLQYKFSNKATMKPEGYATSVPVLIYHGIVDKADGSNTLIADFRDQMFTLKKQGWNAVSLADFESYMAGKKKLPAKSFLLTFDDGRKDSYYPVQPILKALGYKATMFVITEHVTDNNRSTYYLNRDELLAMKNSGLWSLEAHTQNGHDLMDVTADGKKGDFYSNRLWLKSKNRLETEQEFETRVHNDLTGVIKDMQTQFGVTPTAFAYPFGDYGQATINNPKAEAFVTAQVKSLFKYAFAQEQNSSASFGHNAPDQDLLSLQRIEVYPGWTGANLAKIMSIGNYKTLPYHTTFSDVEGWSQQYGDISLDGIHGMRIAPSKGGTGAGVLLDGTRLWNNVNYNVTVNWHAGDTVTLVARYQDTNNYVACVFNPLATYVQQDIKGAKSTIGAKGKGAAREQTTLQMTVLGDTITCGQNNAELAKASGVSQQEHGSIGIQSWDSKPDTSLVYATSASIK